MSILLNISPVLLVADISAEIEFFSKLGFSPLYDSLQYSDKLDYSVLIRENQTIHLQLFDDDSYQGQQVKIWVSSIEEIETELSAASLKYNRHFNTPWNTHELGMYSPSRHAIIFVQEKT